MAETQPTFRFSSRPNRAAEIDWQEWREDTFQRARAEDKPILLSLSAVWCHWCHVMDETTYSEPGIIAAINRDYVPVRVDNDARPDINHRYNMGGWPTTAFLTPDGETLTGATYVPAEQMRVLLAQVAGYYRENRDEITAQVAEVRVRRAAPDLPPSLPPSHETLHDITHEMEEAYDPDNGGFGQAPKFPHPEALDALLLSYQRTAEEWHLKMVQQTAKAMAGAGMYDHAWGGFFRYSTTQDWSVPHFEKMLEDHAALLSLYLKLYQVAPDDGTLETIRRTIEYIGAWLSDAATGAFHGSQDADEEFYALDADERAKHPAPYVDPTVYTAWNAQMISAYFDASVTLGRPDLAQRAARALDFLFDRMAAPEGGLYRALRLPDGAPANPGILADQVAAAHATLDAYEVLSRPGDFDRARTLAQLLRERFQDGPVGAFFDLWEPRERLGKLELRERVIDENARAAELFTRLYALTHDEEYRRTAEVALGAFTATATSYGYFAGRYARAVDRFQHEPAVITIVGAAADPATMALRQAALRISLPFRAVQTLDPARDAARVAALDLPSSPAPRAYVCVGRACSAPIEDAGKLAAVVEGMAQAVDVSHHH